MDNLLVDPSGIALADPTIPAAVGRHDLPMRVVWALPLLGSGLARRFSALAPGESSIFAMDFSFVLPPGAGLASVGLQIFQNTFSPPGPTVDIKIVGDVMVEGTRAIARLVGGVEGVDYQLRWVAADQDGNSWIRTALVLCTQTS